eukprot:scaffold7306_cov191-Ochromonas_danica.AAC.1
MAEIQQLQQQLAQRDTMIEGMKLKFKEYATKLKSHHQEEIESLRKALSTDYEEKIVALERKLASTEEVVKQQTDQLVEMQRLLQSKHEELSACQQNCASSPSENSPFESLAMESLQSELFSLQAVKEKLEGQLSNLQISFNQKEDELQATLDDIRQIKQHAAEKEETLLHELATLQDELKRLNSSISSKTTTSVIEQYEIVQGLKEEVAGLRSALSAKEQEVLSLQEQVSSLDPLKTGLEEEVAGLRSVLSAKEQEVLSLQEQ